MKQAKLKRAIFFALFAAIFPLAIPGSIVGQESRPPTNAVAKTEVPRVRTFPGIESPAFPYAWPEEVGLPSEKLNRLGDEIVEWVANGDLVGAELLIVKDGRAVFHEAYGWSDREERRPMERNSFFSIKSMSKPFAAAAVLMLEEEGRLSLDDPVSRYVPTFAGDERTTIRHLLTHTSGYEGLGDTRGFTSLKGWVEDWASEEPSRPFGEYVYSDFNYAALGYVVESVSGRPVDAFIRERIIEPLGLDETYTAFSSDSSWASRMNSRYRWSDDAADYERYWSNREDQGWPFYPAAWGLWATAMDYAEFMTMWMNKGRYQDVRVLSEGTVEEALRPHASAGTWAYGYGWFVRVAPREDEMPPVFSHGGFDGTLAIGFPAVDAMVIFLTHSRGRGHQSALQNRLGMLEIFDHPGPYFATLEWAGDRKVEEVALAPGEAARYAGIYRGRSGGGQDLVLRVWQEDGRLHLGVGELTERTDWHMHLVPVGDHEFVPARYREDRLEAIDPYGRFRFIVEGGETTVLERLEEGEVVFSAPRADPERIQVEAEAERNRVSIADLVLETLETEGIEAARARHRAIRAAAPDSVRLAESLLNSLGYRLLEDDRISEAIAVFEMNVEAFPNQPNAYDSLGDAYRAAGRLEDARRSYQKAVELAEGQNHPNLPTYRRNLERVTQKFEEDQTEVRSTDPRPSHADTVRVAPPTGEKETDRASILIALEEVEPGGTVQFAPGTYLIGPIIRVNVPDITLLGHPGGTTLRGCHPADFVEHLVAAFECHGFELGARQQTVRNLTFEYTWHGLYVGCCWPADLEAMEAGEGPRRSQPGGHLIEGNTFRYTPNGLRVIGESDEPVVVRDNRFIDVYHAIGINGGTVHFLDNDLFVRDPERVPISKHPGDVINISPFSGLLPLPIEDHTSCRGNVVADNRIDGYPDGIRIVLFHPRSSCRHNEIRDNTIALRRTPFPANWLGIRLADESDSTVVGVPLRLSNLVKAGATESEPTPDVVIADNLIENNRIIGAEGLAIEILYASGNLIAHNTITGIQRRDPFPGNTLGGEPERWREANGTGIWISPGSDGNEIVGNMFDDIASHAVVIAGDRNQVEIRSASDTVLDLGSGNRVSRAASEAQRP